MKDAELKKLIEETSVRVYNSVLKGNSGFMPQIDKQMAILQVHYEDIKNELLEIKTQTTKTNGRVLKAEGDIHNLDKWKSYLSGSLAAIGVVLALVAYIWTSNMNKIEKEQAKLADEISKIKT